MKKYSTIPIILMVFMLSAIPVFQAKASKVVDIRSYSEAAKTRIVFQLDTPVEYHVKNILDSGISLCLTQTQLDSMKQVINISSKQVKSVKTNQTATGVLEINVMFNEKVTYDVFYFNTPFCVVIDIATALGAPVVPAGNQLQLTNIESPPTSSEQTNPASPKEALTASSDISQEDNSVTESKNSKSENPDYLFGFIIQFLEEKYKVIQPYFDILLVIGLIGVSIRIFFMNRFIKDSLINDASRNFVKTMDNLQANLAKENKNIEVASPIKPKIPDKPQVNTINKEPIAQSESTPKQYKKVYELAELGMDRFSISRKSNIPIGEVNLILDLAQAKFQSKVN